MKSLAEVEGRYIFLVMKRCHGNISRAATVLGIGRATLYRKLKGYTCLRCGIKLENSKDAYCSTRCRQGETE